MPFELHFESERQHLVGLSNDPDNKPVVLLSVSRMDNKIHIDAENLMRG